jgi:hypothetical protein
MNQYLEIRKTETGEVVKSLNVTGKSERQIDRIWSGMSINLNHDEYSILLNSDKNVQASDTTESDSSTIADNQK